MKLQNFPVIRDRKLKVAVVGCGRISKNHFQSILKYPEDLELTAVCDVDEAALSVAKDEYGVKGYLQLRGMLKAEELDLVVLCPPGGLHPVS